MSRSVKRDDVGSIHNRNMKLANSLADQQVTDISSALERWYCTHSSIRRLWVLDSPSALTVFVRLEPSADGDDPLPAWLAHNEAWSDDLRSLTKREVHLTLIVTDVFDASSIENSSAMIAELSWRDPWSWED